MAYPVCTAANARRRGVPRLLPTNPPRYGPGHNARPLRGYRAPLPQALYLHSKGLYGPGTGTAPRRFAASLGAPWLGLRSLRQQLAPAFFALCRNP